ncbi:tetratricopeptide repeat protein [Bernardetia sp. MNP-M8]|uniref:tetratricopeptide repeat protein n=1 Tax=Bernardetia sp. MNP-M8 TaxID=3127470 RepID=UPI0030CBA8C4
MPPSVLSLPYEQKVNHLHTLFNYEKNIEAAIVLNNLGALYEAQEKYAEAKIYYEKALAMIKETVGETHPHYQNTSASLKRLDELKAKK